MGCFLLWFLDAVALLVRYPLYWCKWLVMGGVPDPDHRGMDLLHVGGMKGVVLLVGEGGCSGHP